MSIALPTPPATHTPTSKHTGAGALKAAYKPEQHRQAQQLLVTGNHSDLQGHETTASLSCCRQALMSVPCNARVNMASILKRDCPPLAWHHHRVNATHAMQARPDKHTGTRLKNKLCCNLSGCCRLHVQKLITVLPTTRDKHPTLSYTPNISA